MFLHVYYAQENLFKNIEVMLPSSYAFWPKSCLRYLQYLRNIISCTTSLQLVCDASQNKLSVIFSNSYAASILISKRDTLPFILNEQTNKAKQIKTPNQHRNSNNKPNQDICRLLWPL